MKVALCIWSIIPFRIPDNNRFMKETILVLNVLTPKILKIILEQFYI